VEPRKGWKNTEGINEKFFTEIIEVHRLAASTMAK